MKLTGTNCSPWEAWLVNNGLKTLTLRMDRHSENAMAVAKFLERRGEGLHHIAFEVDDVDAELGVMEWRGVELIDRKGRDGVAGKIGFLHPKSVNGVLVELLQPRNEGK